jgi:tetratricopeptide (TPR) repeat protein
VECTLSEHRVKQVRARISSVVQRGHVCYDREDFKSALDFYRRAMKLSRRVRLSACRPHTRRKFHMLRANIFRHMGDCWYRQGEFDGAECCYNFAKRSLQRAHAHEGRIAVAFKDLGDCKYSKDDIDAAQALYGTCLKLASKANLTLLRVVSMCDVADCKRRKGDLEGASKMYESAHTLHDSKPSLLSHPLGLLARGDIVEGAAEYFFRRRDNHRARHYFELALECKSKVFGPEDPGLRDIWMRLSHLCLAEQRSVEAIPHLERLVTMLRKYEPDSMETARIKHRLAQCLAVQRRNTESAQLCEEAVSVFERELSPSSGELRQCLLSWANALCWLNRYVEAEKISRRLLAPDSAEGLDLQTARAVKLLGVSLSGQQKFVEALPHHQSAYALLNRIKGPDDAETVSAREHLNITLAYLGKNPSTIPE